MTPEEQKRISEQNRIAAALKRAKKGYKDPMALSVQTTINSFFKPVVNANKIGQAQPQVQIEPQFQKENNSLSNLAPVPGNTIGSNKIKQAFTFNKINQPINQSNPIQDTDIQNNSINNNILEKSSNSAQNITNITPVNESAHEPQYQTTRSGRRARAVTYIVSSDDDAMGDVLDGVGYTEEPPNKSRKITNITDDDLDFDISDSELIEIEKEMSKSTKPKVSAPDVDFDLDDSQLEEIVRSMTLDSTPKINQTSKVQYITTPIKSLQPTFDLMNNSRQKLQQFVSPRTAKVVSNNQANSSKGKGDYEERYPWLDSVLDANRNPPDHPDYDHRTLFIPSYAWNKFTPFERQFWEIKSQHFDTVVFFKKGKFFELYENDAMIGHQKFDLKLTDRVNMKMVGVPETSFNFWASKFIARGYKVAKVEQMENAMGKSIREKNTKVSKQDKVIRRELTNILTAGTLVDLGMLTGDMSTYCLAIKERVDPNGLTISYGLAVVDASTAQFQLSGFEDDANLTKLETLIMQIKPKEIVYEKGNLSAKAMKLFTSHIDELIKNAIAPETEFWSDDTTLQHLQADYYLGSDHSQWPQAITDNFSQPLILSALGGLVWYLKSLKLDRDLVSLKNFSPFKPIQQANSLVLDGQSLINLEVLENASDGSTNGTILALLDHQVTPFGKRLFRTWLCHPLKNIQDIEMRLDAVEDFHNNTAISDLCLGMKSLPDLERILSRIHSGNIKVSLLIDVLEAFKNITVMINEFLPLAQSFKSDLLKKVITEFPDLTENLSYFETAFNHKLALEEGLIIPYPGVEEDYDAITDKIKGIEVKLQTFLKEQRKVFRLESIEYKDITKEIYQMEVPFKTKVPNNWVLLSQTKQVKRYRTPETNQLVRELEEQREIRLSIIRIIQDRIYSKFDTHYKLLLSAVKRLAVLDCLRSLAVGARLMGEPCIRPEFVEVKEGEGNVLELEELRHPCLVTANGNSFIPNDVTLGGQISPAIILLTGPNMGGKSTLLRQTCVAIIMAQLGCYVPAKKCRLAPFDRIFTRIGANDNIMAGQSTFMVELAETSKIVQEATPQSLVILDELGRGTSTFDGYAIAFAVLYYLCNVVGSLGLFSTHYGMLTDEFKDHQNVRLMFMDCLVDLNQKDVTFLYKLVDGICPKSYGMNVASMAGLPKEVIERASVLSHEFEQQHQYKPHPTTSTELSLIQIADYLTLKNLIKDGGNKDKVKDRIKDRWLAM